ncbi:MAG: xanthine dehydrogenase family protein molybdopterin-binding subunit, partial [Spirochaetia bacterium]|nr:xanthine dehydrogenase family protein molybdopterin-binding subunit [Spirochaetia bacterium]
MSEHQEDTTFSVDRYIAEVTGNAEGEHAKPVFTASRRDFLKLFGASAGALVLGIAAPKKVEGADAPAANEGGNLSPAGWLSIEPSGKVTVFVSKSEMGQGIWTGFPMVVAEELDCDWEKVEVKQAPTNEAIFRAQGTGGSGSIRGMWNPLRNAGAAAKAMLLSAAAAKLGVETSTLSAKKGFVIASGGKKIPFAELVSDAAKLPIPSKPPLKDPADFVLLGKSVPRKDTLIKSSGQAVYGIDAAVPGMLYATIEQPAMFQGRCESMDEAEGKAVPGVKDIFEMRNAVVVVADSYFSALKAKRALKIKWKAPDTVVSQKDIEDTFLGLVAGKGEGETNREGKATAQGDAYGALEKTTKKIEATYLSPYLSHATMEPMNCLASVTDAGVEIWAPTQTPNSAQSGAAKALGIDASKVKVNTTFMGGGFGRRLANDYVNQAVEISARMKKPVKLIWSREEDMRHDNYRWLSAHRLIGGIDDSGKITGFVHRIGAQSPGGECAISPYAVENKQVEIHKKPFPITCGAWRSVWAHNNVFAVESFVDELADLAGMDPFDFRMANLPARSRLRGVLQLVADATNWKSKPPAGVFRGIACGSSFASHAAHVVELSLDSAKVVKVLKVTAAIDCGFFTSPDLVKAQVESAVVDALSATLLGRITIKDNQVVEGNFHEYKL